MDNKNKLRQIVREEIKKELHEGTKGAIIGYLAGVLVDFFTKKKPDQIKQVPEKSLEELEKEMKDKLDRKYNTDPRFKKIVDDLMSGKQIDLDNI